MAVLRRVRRDSHEKRLIRQVFEEPGRDGGKTRKSTKKTYIKTTAKEKKMLPWGHHCL